MLNDYVVEVLRKISRAHSIGDVSVDDLDIFILCYDLEDSRRRMAVEIARHRLAEYEREQEISAPVGLEVQADESEEFEDALLWIFQNSTESEIVRVAGRALLGGKEAQP